MFLSAYMNAGETSDDEIRCQEKEGAQYPKKYRKKKGTVFCYHDHDVGLYLQYVLRLPH
jgi:hypothetical protein